MELSCFMSYFEWYRSKKQPLSLSSSSSMQDQCFDLMVSQSINYKIIGYTSTIRKQQNKECSLLMFIETRVRCKIISTLESADGELSGNAA